MYLTLLIIKDPSRADYYSQHMLLVALWLPLFKQLWQPFLSVKHNRKKKEEKKVSLFDSLPHVHAFNQLGKQKGCDRTFQMEDEEMFSKGDR